MSQEPSIREEGRRQLRDADSIRGALESKSRPRLLLRLRGELSPEAGALVDRAEALGVAVRSLGARELRRLAQGGGEPELLAFTGPDPSADLASVMARAGAIWMLSGTAYPGNAGFVIRSAEVSGAAGVVIDADFDRTARRDAARAAMRADRFLPVFFEATADVLDRASETTRRIIAIEDVGGRAPWEVDLTGPVLFVVGGEEHGIAPQLLDRADEVVKIPMSGFMPSYNLQAAVAAVMAERLRQQAMLALDPMNEERSGA